MANDKATWIIDRFEGTMAVLEQDGRTVDVPRELLPLALREGDVITIDVKRDDAATAARAAEVRALRARLAGRDPGGDIDL